MLFSAIPLISALILVTACTPINNKEVDFNISSPGEGATENDVTVYVVTDYSLTEIVAPYEKYDSWLELLEAEFDGRDEDRGDFTHNGSWVTNIGRLRPDRPSGIVVYHNGKYSDKFFDGCPYMPGDVLAFVQSGIKIPFRS